MMCCRQLKTLPELGRVGQASCWGRSRLKVLGCRFCNLASTLDIELLSAATRTAYASWRLVLHCYNHASSLIATDHARAALLNARQHRCVARTRRHEHPGWMTMYDIMLYLSILNTRIDPCCSTSVETAASSLSHVLMAAAYRTGVFIVKGLREFGRSGYEQAEKQFDNTCVPPHQMNKPTHPHYAQPGNPPASTTTPAHSLLWQSHRALSTCVRS